MHRAWFKGPLVTSIIGLFTLGDRQNTTVTKFMDHSIFMMINGIFAFVIILFFIFLYQLNIISARTGTNKKKKNNEELYEEFINEIGNIFTHSLPIYSSALRTEMPGEKDMCHQSDEYISIDNLLFCCKVYTEAILSL